MASIQYERQAGELSNEEKASLDELIKQAESEDVEAQALAVVAENEGLDKDANPKLPIQITSVVGVLQNQTTGPLSLFKTHIWAGHVVKPPFPNPLQRTGFFAISGVQNKGVKAAVEYSGKNKTGVECGWLIGFSYSKAEIGIYAWCGRINKFNNIDWADIGKKLDAVVKTVKYYDPETGTSVIASITGYRNYAKVAANFSG